MLIVMVIAALSAMAHPVYALPTVKGDPGAWIEIAAAYRRLNQLRTYRIRLSAPDRTTGTLDIVNPDRIHTVVRSDKVQIETIQVGKALRYREGNRWRCAGDVPAFPLQDPTNVRGEVTVTRKGQQTINGVRTRVYAYARKHEAVVTKRRIYLDARTGLPVRLEILNVSWQLAQRLDYYDFDAPFRIALPPCT